MNLQVPYSDLPVKYRIYHSAWQALDWLYPPACAGCGRSGERWCENCRQQASHVAVGTCALCGRPLASATHSHRCPRAGHIDLALAWGLYNGPLRNALHRLKYKRDLALGDTLSRHLLETIAAHQVVVDVVVPVPLGSQRRRERGYNQAALLARPVALVLQAGYLPAALKRQRETESQVGLTLTQRQQNVAGAFAATRRLEDKVVLLVDDVLTTGATLNAAAAALKLAGAKRVVSVVLARAQ